MKTIADILIIVFVSAVCYLFYVLALKRGSAHQLNRAYLLVSLLLSAIFPLLRFPLPFRKAFYIEAAQSAVAAPQTANSVMERVWSFPQWLTLIYWIGFGLFAIAFLIKMVRTLRPFIGKQKQTVGYLRVVSQAQQVTPFSFFHWLAIRTDAYEPEELAAVYWHEEAHARQLHTLDLLFVELAGVVCWFNPFVFVYKKELKTIHEYLADESVLRNGIDRNAYLDLMMKQARGQRTVLAHPFSAELMKSRILMLSRARQNRKFIYKYLLFIPLLLILVTANSLFAIEIRQAQDAPEIIREAPIAVSSANNATQETVVVKKSAVKHPNKSVENNAETSHVTQDVLAEQRWMQTPYGAEVEIRDESKPQQSATKQIFVVISADGQGEPMQVEVGP